jgi:glyoxalase/bleomycin resistance protein/dioxygenase superfamily protein
MQLELIQQRCDTPSMWRDFIQSGREGMQHFAVWPEDYDAAYQRAIDAGFRVCQEGDLTGRGQFVYFEN